MKTLFAIGIIFSLLITSCQSEKEITPAAPTEQEYLATLSFESFPEANGRTQWSITRGYAFTGWCYEYGTIYTDDDGEQVFDPADNTTKLNGFGDICPPNGGGFAHEYDPDEPTTIWVNGTPININVKISGKLIISDELKSRELRISDIRKSRDGALISKVLVYTLK